MNILNVINSKINQYQIPKLFLCFFFLIYPLILFQYNNGNFSIQSIILLLVSMGWLLYHFMQIRKKEWAIRSLKYITDIPILVAAFLAVMQLLLKMLTSDGKEVIGFDIEITVIAMAAIYWIITSGASFYTECLEIILYAGLLALGGLVYRYVGDIEFGGMIAVLVENEAAVAAFTMLICTVGIVQYCHSREMLSSIFYFGVSLIGFFVLFINQNIISICIQLVVFIVIPIIYRPVAELVKRDMQLLFAYLFLLGNMSLITNYTELILPDITYNVEFSVYLDLLMAIGGIAFFWYWDRIPKGTDLERLVLRKMRKGYLFLLKTMGIFFTVILLGGARWQGLPDDDMLLRPLKRFAAVVWEEVGQGKSAFFLSVDAQGIMGGLLLLLFVSFVVARLRKNYHMDKPLTITLILLADLFLVQLLFWLPGVSSLPIYFIILIYAAFYQEPRKKVVVQRVKSL